MYFLCINFSIYCSWLYYVFVSNKIGTKVLFILNYFCFWQETSQQKLVTLDEMDGVCSDNETDGVCSNDETDSVRTIDNETDSLKRNRWRSMMMEFVIENLSKICLVVDMSSNDWWWYINSRQYFAIERKSMSCVKQTEENLNSSRSTARSKWKMDKTSIITSTGGFEGRDWNLPTLDEWRR